MSNEIVRVPQTPTHSEMLEMAKLFVESKMFDGISHVAAAFVKVKAGAEIGIAPFAAMTGIHIIKGKVTIGAGLMAGCVKGSGKYDYRVLKMDDTICSIDFTQAGKVIGNSSFTIQDAKRAGTQNTEKFPRNMLFARAMSNGVKWFCPDVFTMPVYITGEIPGDDEPVPTEDIPHTEVAPVSEPTSVTPTKPALAKKAFNDGLARIKNGETQLAQMMKDTFALSAEQEKELDAALLPAEAVAAQ